MARPTFLDAVQRAIRLAVSHGTDLSSASVVPSHDSDGFAPGETYATVNLLRVARRGHPWYRHVVEYTDASDAGGDPDEGEIVIESQKHDYTHTQLEIVARCECYGPGAYDRMLNLAQWWTSRDGERYMPNVIGEWVGYEDDLALGHLASGPVQRLDDLVSAEWESRASQDVTIGVIATITQVHALPDLLAGRGLVFEE